MMRSYGSGLLVALGPHPVANSIALTSDPGIGGHNRPREVSSLREDRMRHSQSSINAKGQDAAMAAFLLRSLFKSRTLAVYVLFSLASLLPYCFFKYPEIVDFPEHWARFYVECHISERPLANIYEL